MKAPTNKKGIENLKRISSIFGIEFDENNCKESKMKLSKYV